MEDKNNMESGMQNVGVILVLLGSILIGFGAVLVVAGFKAIFYGN